MERMDYHVCDDVFHGQFKYRPLQTGVNFVFTLTATRMMRVHRTMAYFVFPYIIQPITANEHIRISAVMVKGGINNEILIIERGFFLSQIGEHLNTH